MNEEQTEKGLKDEVYWNSDQSRFEYEMKRDRSYAVKGSPIVLAMAAKMDSLSHSYTVQMHVSKAGRLGTKMLIVLQEKPVSAKQTDSNGKRMQKSTATPDGFGPRVQEEVNKMVELCPNIVAKGTTSGKCTNKIVEQWCKEVFALDVKGETVLLLDAWTGQSDKTDYNSFINGESGSIDDTSDLDEDVPSAQKSVDVKYLPKSSTQYIQPLDLYFFRQYKILIKDVTQLVRLRYFKWATDNQEAVEECDDLIEHPPPGAPIRPDNRFFIFRMHATCYNQMVHPDFWPMWRYAWQKGGFETEEPIQRFLNVKQALRDPAHRKRCPCGEHAFMKCLYCKDILCIDCWFFRGDVHYHELGETFNNDTV